VYCLGWKPSETTLISIGTGRALEGLNPYEADHFNPLHWVHPLIDTFLTDANDQQVRFVRRFFTDLDFRRFQVNLDTAIAMDDVSTIPELTRLGEELGHMILNDEEDERIQRKAGKAI
jgi:hypothetical protein